MAIEFSSVSAPTIAVENQVALNSIRSTSSSSRITNIAFELADSLRPNRFITQSIKLNIRDARLALSQAILAGVSIEETLKKLVNLADLATQGGLISPSTNLTVNGTRVSGLNIQTQINRAIRLINKLVATANINGANFISANSLQVKIQTTRFGGSLTITPQPLNSTALDINNLEFLTLDDAAFSAAKLGRAATTAGVRVLALQQLQTALGESSSFNQAFAQFVSSSSGLAERTGALINLSA